MMFSTQAMAAGEYFGTVPAPYTGRAVPRRDSCRGAVGAAAQRRLVLDCASQPNWCYRPDRGAPGVGSVNSPAWAASGCRLVALGGPTEYLSAPRPPFLAASFTTVPGTHGCVRVNRAGRMGAGFSDCRACRTAVRDVHSSTAISRTELLTRDTSERVILQPWPNSMLRAQASCRLGP